MLTSAPWLEAQDIVEKVSCRSDLRGQWTQRDLGLHSLFCPCHFCEFLGKGNKWPVSPAFLKWIPVWRGVIIDTTFKTLMVPSKYQLYKITSDIFLSVRGRTTKKTHYNQHDEKNKKKQKTILKTEVPISIQFNIWKTMYFCCHSTQYSNNWFFSRQTHQVISIISACITLSKWKCMISSLPRP